MAINRIGAASSDIFSILLRKPTLTPQQPIKLDPIRAETGTSTPIRVEGTPIKVPPPTHFPVPADIRPYSTGGVKPVPPRKPTLSAVEPVKDPIRVPSDPTTPSTGVSLDVPDIDIIPDRKSLDMEV